MTYFTTTRFYSTFRNDFCSDFRCSECKLELPKDHEAIKHHMRTEHMPKQNLEDFDNNFEDDEPIENFAEDMEWTGFG